MISGPSISVEDVQSPTQIKNRVGGVRNDLMSTPSRLLSSVCPTERDRPKQEATPAIKAATLSTLRKHLFKTPIATHKHTSQKIRKSSTCAGERIPTLVKRSSWKCSTNSTIQELPNENELSKMTDFMVGSAGENNSNIGSWSMKSNFFTQSVHKDDTRQYFLNAEDIAQTPGKKLGRIKEHLIPGENADFSFSFNADGNNRFNSEFFDSDSFFHAPQQIRNLQLRNAEIHIRIDELKGERNHLVELLRTLRQFVQSAKLSQENNNSNAMQLYFDLENILSLLCIVFVFVTLFSEAGIINRSASITFVLFLINRTQSTEMESSNLSGTTALPFIF
ncbi:hypothetical protein RFI_13232 [Reticulomyxa filosa]|uniref:Uncharacterized protein n=1 Tax=Reticulomyxa filosa TaxID=46433 RepID=X6NF21_RETFI|nr:hypothetical protein RFI_13232 [Reticulomyxa filosa]|eukprot:ETO23927.1 hypothetical protein RFI_13232 [Reticulomyxa filosa]